MLAELIHKIAGMEQHYGKYTPRASSAGPERCIRSMVYHRLNMERESLSGRTMLIFDDGHWHEELTLDWLRQSAFQVHSEQMHINIPAMGLDIPERKCSAYIDGKKCGEIIPAGHIAGHNDAIITDILGEDIYLELKGINHFSFQRFWNGEYPLDYLYQVAVCMHGIQKYSQPELKKFNLLIKNKNTAQYMEFVGTYSYDELIVNNKTLSDGTTEDFMFKIEKPWAYAMQKFINVENYAKQKIVPKRQYGLDDWQCDYCIYQKLCYKNYEKEFKQMETDVVLATDIADAVRYRQEVGGHKGDIGKEYEQLTKTIKDFMIQNDIRTGRAGDEYIVERRLYQRAKIDESKIPAAILEKARVSTPYERLFIRKIGDKDV